MSKLCTSQVTSMSTLFNGNADFNEDISDWDVSGVTSMSNMFQ
ncbi:MAG: BspA family leucine-rich repeat surface protein [Patescibacteria group bacterium]|nr:BspA family leucine-rich repeat surface protein [Patescibacteria group bacterium]